MQMYASLHNHTMFSNLRLRDSINTTQELIDRAIELGHSGIAITEHETVANAIEVEEYYEKIKETHPDFKVMRGNEIYLVRNGLNATNFNKDYDRYTHFILLALDAEGHKQIRQLSTRAWMRSYMARGMRRVPTYYQDLIDIIGANPGHVIGASACIGGTLGTQLLRYRKNKDESLLQKIKNWCNQINDIFGTGNFYLEMQPSDSEEQKYVNKWIINLSNELNIPFIISNDSHYLKKEDLKIQKIFLNAQNGEREVEDFYATTYLMSEEEIHSFMDSTIGSENVNKAFININNILKRAVDYTLKKPLKIPSLQWREVVNYCSEYPKWIKRMPTLEKILNSEYKSDRYLVDVVIDGIKRHSDLQNDEAYNELELCLQDTWISSQVNKAQWSAYFLNLQRIIDVCWEAGTIVGCGRGSGVGFLLLYCLDITQINPLRETTKTFRFRFLNPERVSVLDIDLDISGLNRDKILNHIREVYGQDRVANVLTLRTEKSKSAILAAARGLGINVDIAQYIASLIPSERGQLWSLHDCMYGNEEDRQPIKQFVFEMTENYPEIWEVVQKTENLIVGMGEHAGGLIFVDESFDDSTALMRAPNGDIMTQFELHTSEKASLIKYDLLSVEAIDKIQICLNLLIEYGYVKKYNTLRETYENCIGIYNLERNAPDMWKMVWNHEIQSLFQMEQQSGIQGIALTHPQSVDDLAVLNSVIRLMAQEKGAEQPLNKFARFKNDIRLWYDEMTQYGLTEEEQKLLEPIVKLSYGISESQEKFMQLVQMPECGGFNLTWADKLRKSIAKKNPAAYEELQKEYFETVEKKGLSKNLCNYVWNVLVATSRGYGFNASHTLAYSLIALQEMNLAYKYPIIFWNCACLISDSGGASIEEENEEGNGEYEIATEIEYNSVEGFNDEDEEDDDPEEGNDISLSDKKKKTKTVSYGKIAAAIGKMTASGVKVTLPDINLSTYTFSPDATNNIIRYGLSGISKIGDDIVRKIMSARPFNSLEDFTNKVKLNKSQMINLIKCGAFDSFGNREQIMHDYIESIADIKKRLTLQNMAMLIKFNLIPNELSDEVKIYNFNKYLKANCLVDADYEISDYPLDFFYTHFSDDKLSVNGSSARIAVKDWEKIYKKAMDPIRDYLKQNNKDILSELNNKIINELWDKYCSGSISKWEMDSVCFYSHPHELSNIDDYAYNIDDFFELNEQPEIDRIIPINGKQIQMYKLHKIAGTVLDKDKSKNTVTILTKSGVVPVKVWQNQFTKYDKQISEIGADGKKHVIEKSFFARGNKVMFIGIRRDAMFVPKIYKNSGYDSPIGLITDISKDGELKFKFNRVETE